MAARPCFAVDPEKLKAFIPDQVDGIPRTALTSQSAGANGVSTSDVEAEYAKDGAHITLRVTDLAAMGAFAGLADADRRSEAPGRRPAATRRLVRSTVG